MLKLEQTRAGWLSDQLTQIRDAVAATESAASEFTREAQARIDAVANAIADLPHEMSDRLTANLIHAHSLKEQMEAIAEFEQGLVKMQQKAENRALQNHKAITVSVVVALTVALGVVSILPVRNIPSVFAGVSGLVGVGTWLVAKPRKGGSDVAC